jgi:hypothetical protein
VADLAALSGATLPTHIGFAGQLEILSQELGHGRFRRELQQRLLSPLSGARFDLDVAASLGLVGVRAGPVVSFNIEATTSVPLMLMRGASNLNWRTFRPANARAVTSRIDTDSGPIAPPIYFPHGLLNEGNVVMTESEYMRHKGSLAVMTAVHLAIGGDLVILGMSLADEYLREAILSSRHWIRDVYWFNETFGFREWARVADITCVQVPHAKVWDGLASSITRADRSGMLAERMKVARPKIQETFESLARWQDDFRDHLYRQIYEFLAKPHSTEEQVTALARYCEDTGTELPTELRSDPRCKL